ncbi:MAG: Spy/CpxP family protein refolding chaperone [Prolixibacteraceae bacterium]
MWEKNKYRILIWLVVVFFATTVSMAVSFLYHKNQEFENFEESVEEAIELPANRRTRFFRKQLNLRPNQMEIFRKLNRNFNRSAWQITKKLERHRIEMIQELGAQNPDHEKLDSITREIGHLHTELKNLTVEYYLGMKQSIDPEQQKKLNEIFMSVLQNNEDVKLPGKGNGRSNRRFR